MRGSKDGKTIGFTLRLPTVTYQAYAEMASKANLVELGQGRPGRLTAQDMMRERLEIPEAIKDGGGDGN